MRSGKVRSDLRHQLRHQLRQLLEICRRWSGGFLERHNICRQLLEVGRQLAFCDADVSLENALLIPNRKKYEALHCASRSKANPEPFCHLQIKAKRFDG